MICEQCKKEGRKSRVFPGASECTLMMYMRFYDEDGREHLHDPNVTTTYYSCSNGHSWREDTRHKCWCKKEE